MLRLVRSKICKSQWHSCVQLLANSIHNACRAAEPSLLRRRTSAGAASPPPSPTTAAAASSAMGFAGAACGLTRCRSRRQGQQQQDPEAQPFDMPQPSNAADIELTAANFGAGTMQLTAELGMGTETAAAWDAVNAEQLSPAAAPAAGQLNGGASAAAEAAADQVAALAAQKSSPYDEFVDVPTDAEAALPPLRRRNYAPHFHFYIENF